jgi:replication-associated recombination protein RarA
MTPNQFKPTCASDFAGSAGAHAKVVLSKCDRLLESKDGNYRVLFFGLPGTGKSSLAAVAATKLAASPFSIEVSTGQSASVEQIRKWSYNSGHKSMFGGRHVLIIEECDAMSYAALTEWRKFSDNLPPCYDTILTTNKTLKKLQPQLSSRCQTYHFCACPVEDLAAWLASRWSVPMEMARKIAQQARGDVRAALNTLESALDEMLAERRVA